MTKTRENQDLGLPVFGSNIEGSLTNLYCWYVCAWLCAMLILSLTHRLDLPAWPWTCLVTMDMSDDVDPWLSLVTIPSPTLLFLFRCCDTAFFGKGMVLLAFLSQLRFPSLMQQYQPCFYLTTLSDRPVKLFTFPIFLFFSPGSEWTTCPVYSFFAQLILQIFYTHRVVLVLDIDSSKPVLPCLFTSFT